MINFLWTSAGLFLVWAISAASAVLSSHRFSSGHKKWIYFFSGIAPVFSIVLVYCGVAEAGPYNLFIDPVICIAWVLIVNFLFYLLGSLGRTSAFHIWLTLVLLGPLAIRLSVANVFS